MISPVHLCLVCRKVTDLVELTMYPPTLLKLLMISRGFLGNFENLYCDVSYHLQIGVI